MIQSAEKPRLRPDLQFTSRQTPEGTVFVVKDPATRRFYQFGEIEHEILSRLDGRNSLQDIRQLALDNDCNIETETLEQFVEQLSRMKLLDSGKGRPAPPAREKRIRGSLLYLRFPAFDPDRLLERLARKGRFFFTPYFLVLSIGVILFAFAITALQWNALIHGIRNLWRFQAFLLAWVILLCVVTLHEFAHGLTCKYFGGEVHEMGFLLIYFQPAFYCNVSDAWLFPQKSRRLWVSFAGGYFEMFLWALATLVWRVTDPSTLINYLALVVTATSGIKTLFNLNPLIKLDGYYLLSDWLEIPNLRYRAFSYLGDQVRKLWGSDVRRTGQVTPRERRIYWTYGLLAWAYSYWLLSLVALNVGSALVRRYQAWGFVLFLLLLFLVFQLQVTTPLRTPLEWVKAVLILHKWVKRFVRLAIVGAALAALFLYHTELTVSGPFTVLPVHNADVRAEVEGIIQQVYVDEGDRVRKGDVIARLSDRDLQAELRKTKAEIDEKEARLNLLKAGTRREEMELARTARAKAKQELKYATNLLKADRALYADRLIPKRQFEETEEQVAVRTKELQEAEDKLKLLRAGSRRQEIEATAAELRRLQAQEHYIEQQLRLLTIVSPIEGIVTTHKLKDRVGEAISKGDLITKVHAMQTLTVEIAVPEKEIADVKLDQKVVLKARAYPQKKLEGRVTSIAPIASETDEAAPGERTVRVTTQVDNPGLLLKPEMTGHAKVYCDKQRLIDIMMRRLIRYLRVEFWSWW